MRRKLCLAVFASLLTSASVFAATPTSTAQTTTKKPLTAKTSPRFLDLSLISYATDSSPVSRISTEMNYRSQNAELGVSAFIETGAQSFWKFDPDPMVLRSSNFWIGRTHPFLEGRSQADRPQVREALGLPWVQNQVDPLQPKVSGWMSVGYHGTVKTFKDQSRLKLNLAFSPIFTPTFSPSLGLSNRDGLNPERWARLPPLAVELPSGALVPISYRLEMSRLSNVILQNQFFASTTYESKSQRTSFLFWSAPSANPVAGTAGELQVDDTDVNARVTVTPKFPRQNFLGAQTVLFPDRNLSVDLQISRELKSGATLGSLRIDAKKINLEGGLLATLQEAANSDSGAAGLGRVPTYADSLLWLQTRVRWHAREPSVLSSNLRLERHLLTGLEGNLVSASLDYTPHTRLRFSAVGTLLSGTDNSYYGTWRALDTVRMGVAYLW